MILVTGANGFIGRHFNFDDDNFRRVVRLDKKKYRTDFCISSLDSSTDWSGAFQDVDSIIHLAGVAHSKSYLESDYISVNLEGTVRLAREAMKSGVKRFVFVSTVLVNGSLSNNKPFSPSDEPKPQGVNAVSKLAAEIELLKLSSETGLEVVIVRPPLVYGPNAPGNFGKLTKLVERLPLLPFGAAKNRRDFISVYNLVDLLVVCARHKKAKGKVFLASEGEPVSIRDLSNAISNGLDRRALQIPVPISVMKFVCKLIGKSSMGEQLFGEQLVDSSNLKEELEWLPPFTMKQAMSSLRNLS
ncbi:NAD-dependent epimerase/dehydratase family protein [Vibrio splendidus]